jgi:hypothetical protein
MSMVHRRGGGVDIGCHNLLFELTDVIIKLHILKMTIPEVLEES